MDAVKTAHTPGSSNHRRWNRLAAWARAGGLQLVTIDQGFRPFEGLKLSLLQL